MTEEAKEVAILQQLKGILHLPGAPKTEEGVAAVTAGVARFVRNERMTHARAGEVNDLDWLMKKIIDTCEFFPQVPEMRRIYEDVFPPLDDGDGA